MSDYVPPLKDILFNLHELSDIDAVLELPAFADFDRDVVDQVVTEATRFSAEVVGPLKCRW